jgi:hypothetical protein
LNAGSPPGVTGSFVSDDPWWTPCVKRDHVKNPKAGLKPLTDINHLWIRSLYPDRALKLLGKMIDQKPIRFLMNKKRLVEEL